MSSTENILPHTEGAWKYYEREGSAWTIHSRGTVFTPGDILIAETYTTKDAAYIVQAVNTHAALVAALQSARLQIEYLHEKFQATGSGNQVLGQIDAALQGTAMPEPLHVLLGRWIERNRADPLTSLRIFDDGSADLRDTHFVEIKAFPSSADGTLAHIERVLARGAGEGSS